MLNRCIVLTNVLTDGVNAESAACFETQTVISDRL